MFAQICADYWAGGTLGDETSTNGGIDPVVVNAKTPLKYQA